MSSQFRTVLVGVGVIAICLTMASLKGHHLLMAFAAASLVGGIWTWMHNHSRKPIAKQPPVANASYRRARSTAATANGSGKHNVYQFPSSSSWNVSDASGS